MRLTRIHHPQPLTEGLETTLEESASTHVLRVLRLRPGAELRLFDGGGNEYEAALAGNIGGRAQVRVGSRQAPVAAESPLAVTLAQGISRGERMDLTLQKSVELGVQRIVPLVTAHTQVRLSGDRLARRQQHWEGVIIAACEQCGRAQVPELLPMITLDDWLDQSGAEPGEALRLVLDHRAERRLRELSPPAAGVTLLIGPEGGLEETEIAAAARRAGYLPLGLGPRILRTETAGLAALAALQTLWGDMG